ncbi:XRE family transcriptional regulator (plasmid) [Deinococcus psychrotolerans]|uniref:XRE family transcriptional regulator n=1 Tax=Deinococcus psychrotolerans TaxID=2489213 RepID=A0A3G8YLA4_9DEIO|nr:helix-turn-helix transcriptional regulator [Deinococcus psychrotolerans]AZI45077.1 XRE family transcriptional regulator [Deinococcus psychrotolerans]
MQQFTTYQTQQRGFSVTVFGVPTTFSADGEELGFDLKVMRDLDLLIARAVEAAAPNVQVLELQYLPLAPAPDPVSLELRRALRLRQMSGAQVAQQLGVTPPVVSRWLSPDYHAHGMETLRRMAEVLEMDVEVRLVPKCSA